MEKVQLCSTNPIWTRMAFISLQGLYSLIKACDGKRFLKKEEKMAKENDCFLLDKFK
jgi:hypothetical protein